MSRLRNLFNRNKTTKINGVKFKEIKYNGGDLLVSLDYVKVGDLRNTGINTGDLGDSVRFPPTVTEANLIVRFFGCMLPSKEMVDAIYEQADLKLPPYPLDDIKTNDPDFYNGGMTKPKYFTYHSAIIDNLIDDYDDPKGALIAGHKKDIVHTQRSNRITIYGWHKSKYEVIQPLSSVHGKDYKDYSHGLRLVKWK